MRSFPRFEILFALAFAMFVTSPASAAWNPLGNPLCSAVGDQAGANLLADGSGGAFVVWLDQRRGYPPNTDLYATHLLADGSISPGWPVNGLPLAATGLVTLPSLAHDGAGGLMAFWFDQSTYQARMQHVDGSGARAPGFAADGNILPMVIGGPSGYIVRALSDEAGGAYFMWNNFNGSSDVMYLTRLTGSGGFTSGWNASGVAQAYSDAFSPFTGFSSVLLVSDPTGGALTAAIWHVEDFPTGGHIDGSVRRTLANGATGFFTTLYPPSLGAPLSIGSDNSGGMFVAWATGTAPMRRMQHYLSSGSAAWPNPTPAPVSDVMLRDGSGGFYLLGRPPAFDQLELHRRLADGSTPASWSPAGFVASTTGSYSAFAAAPSGNQVYVCWSSGPTAAHDLRAVAVTPDGALAPGWPAGGTTVCNAPGNQVLSAMMPISTQDALIAWSDLRSGNSDVYVTLLEPSGPVTLDAPNGGDAGHSGLAFAARSPAPNPARARVEFTFTLPHAAAAALEIVDIAGRVCSRLDAEPRTGQQSLSLDAASLPAGLYWARLRQGVGNTSVRFVVAR